MDTTLSPEAPGPVAPHEGSRDGPAPVARHGSAPAALHNAPAAPHNAPAAPHNIEAEQALLGAILINNDALDRVLVFLEEHHFYDPLHGRIFAAMAQLINSGRLAAPVVLRTWFETDAALAEIGGAAYFSRLAQAATTIINAAQYGRIIYELALRRDLLRIGQDIYAAALNAPADHGPEAQVEQAEQALYAVAEKGRYEGGLLPLRDSLKGAIDMAGAAYRRDTGAHALSTGFTDLDRMTGGLQKSDLIIVAGRPSMGKTALVTNIAFNVARSFHAQAMASGDGAGGDGNGASGNMRSVGVFSLEMSAEQLALRMVSEETGVPSDKIRRGAISEDEFNALVAAQAQLQGLPLYIDQTGAISIAAIAARARRLARQHGLGLVVVDYLQLAMAGGRRHMDNRVQEVSIVTQGLKALAKELDVPVIAAAQLSRQVEAREDKHPQLADLRESGSIEQDADIVLFVYREEYYKERTQPREGTQEHAAWQQDMDKVHGLAEIIQAKHRHGATGMVRMRFSAGTTRFHDYAPDDHLPEQRY